MAFNLPEQTHGSRAVHYIDSVATLAEAAGASYAVEVRLHVCAPVGGLRQVVVYHQGHLQPVLLNNLFLLQTHTQKNKIFASLQAHTQKIKH